MERVYQCKTPCEICRGLAKYHDPVTDKYYCRSNPKQCWAVPKFRDISQNKCDYCGIRTATHYFPTSDRYCCEEKYHQCPSNREFQRKKMKKVYRDSKWNKFKRKIERGEVKCKYCDETARFFISNAGCCQPNAKKCPNYTKFVGDKMRKKWKDPEYKKLMSKVLVEAQNRPEVKEAKSDAMIVLHNEDCEPCKSFQKNYREGYAKRRMDWAKNRTVESDDS